MFSLKDKQKNPESIMVELTPQTIVEEKSLRNATILHKNNIQVCWGDTLELGNVRGSITQRNEEEEIICMDGLKINFRLPKPEKPFEGFEYL